MSLTSVPTYLVRSDALDTLAGKPIGKLRARLTRGENDFPFTVLDTHDEHLRRRGTCLVQSGSDLLLWPAATGPITQHFGKDVVTFVTDLPDGPVKQALGAVPELRSLLPMAQGRMQQVLLALVDTEEKTRARAEFHVLTAQAGSAAIVQPQALRGYDGAYTQLIAALGECGAKTLTEASVIAALDPDHRAYVAKPDLKLDAKTTSYDAATEIIKAYLAVARRNEAGIIADTDIEFLHDYRIALRKIRSVLSLFQGVYKDKQTLALKQQFSDLMTLTGRLRDLDVYLQDRQVFFDLLPESLHAGLDRMFQMFAKERTAQLATLSAHMQSPAYEAEITTLINRFDTCHKLRPGPEGDQNAQTYAAKLIWKRYRKICQIAAAIDDQTEDEMVHELRIQCKKLRYLMEFFAPAFPKTAFKSLLKPLKKLQDNLGLFNDYSVQQDSLAAFLDSLGTKNHDRNMQLAQSVGALIAVLHQRQREERLKVVDSFAMFNSTETQQTFRDLFHGGKR
jgi:CHAD domain-containing protein